jgi:hypothetical protein
MFDEVADTMMLAGRSHQRGALAATVVAGSVLAMIPVLADPAIGAQPAPVVTAVCRVGLAKPQCFMGPVSGGYEVAVSGHGFTGATQVSFDGMNASSFTVKSATRIIAVAPKSTLLPARAQRVSVIVTTPGGTSARCVGRHAACAAAFFYARSTSLAGSGTNFSHPFSGSVGSATYSGTVSIGSWAISGSAQSSGNGVPVALLASGKLLLAHLEITLTADAGISSEFRIRLPIPGLPSIAGVYLRLVPDLDSDTTLTDALAKDTVTFALGWVNGAGYDSGTSACHPAGCLGKPVYAEKLAGSLIAGPWLQIGPSLLNVGAGPALGVYRDTAGVFDACAGLQAEAEVLTIRKVYNLYGPVNLSGTFADCPLAVS